MRTSRIGLTVFAALLVAATWQPSEAAEQKLRTSWGESLDRSSVLPEYPRPQMVRESWSNLNGVWQFAMASLSDDRPAEFDAEIVVPFPVESALSGVEESVTPTDAVWYRREFEADASDGQRVLLHFGAVDWECSVFVNGQRVGGHRGGFDPFEFDITEALRANGPQELVVRVTDPTNRGPQPTGKQSLEPGGIVYTAVTGIWQTVWLEAVPATHIAGLKLTPDVQAGELVVVADVVGPDAGDTIVRIASEAEGGAPLRVTGKPGQELRLKVPNARLWSPDDPYLYDLAIDLAVGPSNKRSVVDRVESYFGMRSVEVKHADDGFQRIHLNGKPIFNYGPLDQGWWPDGLYTAPTDEALRWDVEATKRYGFNTCRKHVKVEPARWYYWCDKLGLLVWQDMPNGDRAIGPHAEDIVRSPESEEIFRTELTAMIDTLHNFPSIVIWVPFNEGWGQFKTNEILEWVREYDPTRLVDGPSGWTDRGVGDLIDMHDYPGPSMHSPGEGRASALGEFGGLGLTEPGHMWFEAGNWGYQSFASREDLALRYRRLLDNVWLMKRDGLAAAIYTQITDVETEVNGLITYDRKVFKIDPDVAADWNRRLYQPAPKLRMLAQDSRDPSAPGQVWRYTTDQPNSKDWASADFDDSGWRTGRAGFGTPNTPGATVRTEWETPDIWLRRTVTFKDAESAKELILTVHHDEDAEIYLDGVLFAELTEYTTDYRIVSAPNVAARLLADGEHVLSIHCHQTRGGQYVDVGVAVIEPAKGGTEQTARLPSAAGDTSRSR